jgi:hypothetical protein
MCNGLIDFIWSGKSEDASLSISAWDQTIAHKRLACRFAGFELEQIEHEQRHSSHLFRLRQGTFGAVSWRVGADDGCR